MATLTHEYRSLDNTPALYVAPYTDSGVALQLTGVSLTNANPLHVAVVDGSGNQVTSFGGSITSILGITTKGQATMSNSFPVVLASDQSSIPVTVASLPLPTLAATSTKQSDGSQKTQIVDGSGNVIGATSNALDINIKSGNPTTIAVTQTTASNLNAQVVGNIASAATDSGNPVKIGGKYNSTQPTFSDGQRGDVQLSARGSIFATLYSLNAGAAIDYYADNADAVAVTTNQNSQPVISRNTVFNGTSWDRMPGTTAGVKTILQTQTDTVMIGGVNVKEINAVTPLMGNGTTGTGSLRVTIASDNTAFSVNATLSAETTKVIGVVRNSDGAGNLLTSNSTTFSSKFGLDSNILGTLGTAFTDAGKVNVQGGVATNVAVADKLLNLGAQAISSENTAVTATRMAQLVTDLVGKLIVLPYANPENFVSGAITSAMTGTTSTSLIAAPASGLRNYITQITVSNSHATVGTDVIIQDGSGGTTLYTIPAAAVYGGAVVVFPTPLRQPTTATAIYCANVTTGASTKVSASGWKGA